MFTDELNHLISDATITDVTEARVIEILVNLLSMDQLECAHRNILGEWRDEGGDVSAHESTEYGDTGTPTMAKCKFCPTCNEIQDVEAVGLPIKEYDPISYDLTCGHIITNSAEDQDHEDRHLEKKLIEDGIGYCDICTIRLDMCKCPQCTDCGNAKCTCAWCYDCDRPTDYCHCKKVSE